MNFFEQQDRSRQATKQLLGLFGAAALFTCICIYFAVMLTINSNGAWKLALFGDRLTCTPIAASPHYAIDPTTPIPTFPASEYQAKRSFGGGRSRNFSGGSGSGSRPFGSNDRGTRIYVNDRNNNYRSSAGANCQPIWLDAKIFFWTLIGTILGMGIPSWWKINQLKAGGAVIATELGGQRVFPETATPAEQQLLNIVEEMAIAATIAVPPVYLLANETGINAFAAGFTVNDAVIGVTQGSLDQLSRDELQGAIAHEFSHILNGDMAINIRLMGMLHGILCLHVLGRVLTFVQSRDNPLWTFGILLRIIGFSGFISGRLIQSAISRQREYLADASAVQFTRNPDGIAGALEKIGGYSSQIDSPHAETSSHMFFSPALNFSWFEGLFSSHPPLEHRINVVRGTGKKLGSRIVVNGQVVPNFNPIASLAGAGVSAAANVEAATTTTTEPIGEYDSIAYVYALLLDPDFAADQLAYLANVEEPAVIDRIEELRANVEALPPHQRLSALDRRIPHIGEGLRSRLLQCAVGSLDLLPTDRWQSALTYLVLNHRLGSNLGDREIYTTIEPLKAEIVAILATVARLSADSFSQRLRQRSPNIDYRFESGLMRLPASCASSKELPPTLTWRELQDYLSKLNTASTKIKQTASAACLEAAGDPRQLSPDAADLLRAIAILLNLPVPSQLVGAVSPLENRATRGKSIASIG